VAARELNRFFVRAGLEEGFAELAAYLGEKGS
jgi:hypothetical protein